MKHEFWVQWVGWVCSLQKILTRLRGTNFCTTSARFPPSFVRQPNGSECIQIVWNATNLSLRSNGVDRLSSLEKIPTRLRGQNFCTSSAHFAPSFVSQLNGPKCTKILWNTPKHFFRVQWGGSGAFVSKNSDATSWNEFLHKFGPFWTECCNATNCPKWPK